MRRQHEDRDEGGVRRVLVTDAGNVIEVGAIAAVSTLIALTAAEVVGAADLTGLAGVVSTIFAWASAPTSR